jgi:hypothetical protein
MTSTGSRNFVCSSARLEHETAAEKRMSRRPGNVFVCDLETASALLEHETANAKHADNEALIRNTCTPSKYTRAILAGHFLQRGHPFDIIDRCKKPNVAEARKSNRRTGNIDRQANNDSK